MPALALDEFRLHLAAFQEQERADAEAKRGQEQEHERQQELLREQQNKQAEHKRQVDMQKQAHAQKQAQEKQADAKRKQQEQHQKQQNAGIDRKEDGRQTPTQPPSAAAEAATAAAATAVAAAAAATKQITLGLSFSKCNEGGMKVARLKDGGCAALHGGIQIGDRVLRIDEQDLAEKSALQLNKLLSGPENSNAVLQVNSCHLHLGARRRRGFRLDLPRAMWSRPNFTVIFRVLHRDDLTQEICRFSVFGRVSADPFVWTSIPSDPNRPLTHPNRS